MSYGRNFPHSTPTGKRSASCSNNPPKLAGSTANNNNHFYSRYPTSPAMSLIQQSQIPYSPGTYRNYKGTSYLHNAKYEGLSRYRTRDSGGPRDVPVKSTYRPDNLNDWNYASPGRRDPHFGSLTKPARNVDVSDLSLSGLSVSSPLSIKKSTSHQDMSGSNRPPGYHLSTNYPRPLPDLRGCAAQRRPPQSTVHFSRRSSFTRGKIPEESRDVAGFVRSSVADTVARLNRRNEAERLNFSGRLEESPDDPSEGLVERNDVSNDDNNCESTSSSTTNSPNNNTNNFSRKYMNKGCTGLQNIGNTCFMNCVLQCLSNTRPLLELSLNSDLLKEINTDTSRLKGSLATSYVELMQSMWRGLGTISPSQFKYEVSKFARLFAGYNQQDAQEFLMYLLQGLHEDLNRVREKRKKATANPRRDSNPQAEDDRISASEKAILSWKRHLELENSYIVDLFEGLLKSALKCRLCGYISNTFDPFLGLSLPIKKVPGHGDTTLMDCLELFTHEELLDENEKSTCDKCKKKQNSTKRLSIQKFPKILVINLKRFSEESLFRSKLSTLVRCPVKNLDLRKFSDENVGDRAIYNLYGVCNHSGTPLGGHYTALARNPYSNEWHYFNDQRVSSISENSDLVTSEAYILFYELSSK